MSISIDLSGDVAVVTGGGSGIGEAIARTLARAGAAVAVADLSQESAQRVAKQIEADGGRALAVALDIADRACVEAGLAAVREGLGPVKHLVNNAATWEVKSFADHTAADIDRVVGVTLTGTMTITQAALPGHHRAARHGGGDQLGQRAHRRAVHERVRRGQGGPARLHQERGQGSRPPGRQGQRDRARHHQHPGRLRLHRAGRRRGEAGPGLPAGPDRRAARTSPTWPCSWSPRSRRG